MHSAWARRSRGEVPLGVQADWMLMISWQGGITGEVVLGKQTSSTGDVLVESAIEGGKKAYDMLLRCCWIDARRGS